MVQTVSGIILLVIGLFLIVQNLVQGQRDDGRKEKGFIGRFGTLMLGLVIAFLGVALVLPARTATPTPGDNTNPVDNAVEDTNTSQ